MAVIPIRRLQWIGWKIVDEIISNICIAKVFRKLNPRKVLKSWKSLKTFLNKHIYLELMTPPVPAQSLRNEIVAQGRPEKDL